MSRKKHVESEYMYGDIQPPTDAQCIARALGTRGGNILEVEFEGGSTTLCMIPAKFNKKLWIRRGGLVVVEQTVTEATGAKVTANVVAVLYAEHLKQFRKAGVHIPAFRRADAAEQAVAAGDAEAAGSDAGSDPGSGSEDSIPVNTNHRKQVEYVYTDSDDADDA